MKHLQLQPRLRLLADMVPAGAHLADIGTDHGYLPVWLMQQGRIASAIAADIGPEPLAHARRKLKRAKKETYRSFMMELSSYIWFWGSTLYLYRSHFRSNSQPPELLRAEKS